MIFTNGSRFKPLYKQFIKFRDNIQNRKKLLKFKNNKWKNLIQNYENKLKWHKKFQPKDQSKVLIAEWPNQKFSYKKRYKNVLFETQKFKLYYGGFSQKSFKKFIKLMHSKKYKNTVFTDFFERRLDTVLYRAKFSTSIKTARQLIFQNLVLVNKIIVKTKSYLLSEGDLISLNLKLINRLTKNLRFFEVIPIVPQHLTVNYKIMQIVFGLFNKNNCSINFHFFNLEKLISNPKKH